MSPPSSAPCTAAAATAGRTQTWCSVLEPVTEASSTDQEAPWPRTAQLCAAPERSAPPNRSSTELPPPVQEPGRKAEWPTSTSDVPFSSLPAAAEPGLAADMAPSSRSTLGAVVLKCSVRLWALLLA